MNFTPPYYVGKTQSGGFMAVITGVGGGMWGHFKNSLDSWLTLPPTIKGALFEPLLSKPYVTQLNSTQSNSKTTSLRLDTEATWKPPTHQHKLFSHF